jgi:imidazolonepropionase-like amidohydrolase
MTTLLRNVRIFDGYGVIDSDALRVHDDRIIAVGSGLVPRTDETVVQGGTVIPGLIDAHTHVFPGSLEQALAFGVTTEIDMFAEPTFATAYKLSATTRRDHADIRSAGTGATVAGRAPDTSGRAGHLPAVPHGRQRPGGVRRRPGRRGERSPQDLHRRRRRRRPPAPDPVRLHGGRARRGGP